LQPVRWIGERNLSRKFCHLPFVFGFGRLIAFLIGDMPGSSLFGNLQSICDLVFRTFLKIISFSGNWVTTQTINSNLTTKWSPSWMPSQNSNTAENNWSFHYRTKKWKLFDKESIAKSDGNKGLKKLNVIKLCKCSRPE
jgi:hypothetical protein